MFPVDGGTGLVYRCPMVRIFPFIAAMVLMSAPALAVDNYRSCIALVESAPAEALTEALQWRDLGGGSPARHCVALAHAANGDLRLAAVRLQELSAEIEPANKRAASQVMAQAAAVWLQVRDDVRAIPAFQQAITLWPENPQMHLDLAHVLAAQGRFDEAASEVAAALRLDDLSADAFALKAMLHREQEAFDAADEALSNALALNPDLPMARMEQALARARGGDINGARQDLTDLIAQDPDGNIGETARRYLQELDVE